jgi:hypothetical protein
MADGIHYPLDYSIQDLNLITGNGQRTNFKRLMINISYYEDLFNFVTSGSLSVLDGQGFIEKLQLTGNEFIEIQIGKMKDAPDNITEIFRVYKIEKRKPSGTQNSESYDLLFCSEELFLNEQIKISRSYPGTKISDIINDILTNQLKVSSNKIGTIEPTTGVYDFLIPNMKPFEAISWISTYSRPQNYPGSDMLFYQTKEGFNFRSLQSIYQDDLFGTYKYSTKNVDYAEQQNEDKQSTVQKFEFIKSYDTLHDANSGAFANRLISIDPLIRSYYVTDFDYTKYKSNSKSLNDNAPANFFTNRLGEKQNESYNGVLKVAYSNKDEKTAQYIGDDAVKAGSVAHDIFIETYVPLRTAQISLLNYTKLKLTIPGDPALTVGKVIEFKMNSLNVDDGNKDGDRFYSGKYIITALRHIFTNEQFQTVVEIAKDSSPNPYQSIQQTTDWTEVIKS